SRCRHSCKKLQRRQPAECPRPSFRLSTTPVMPTTDTLLHPELGRSDDSAEDAVLAASVQAPARPLKVPCAHCLSDVPEGLISGSDVDLQFCCAGCRTAFAILSEHGLDG